MKCSDCQKEDETVQLRQANKVVNNTIDRRLGANLGVRLNKHLCDECWNKWNKDQ